MNIKPDCFKCKWRGEVVGSAHSCCKHPKNEEILNNSIAQMLNILAGARKVPLPSLSNLKVKGDEWGIKNGWFNFPFNFDPVWLLECNGFKQKEETE